jgi:hypothetical protein
VLCFFIQEPNFNKKEPDKPIFRRISKIRQFSIFKNRVSS